MVGFNSSPERYETSLDHLTTNYPHVDADYSDNSFCETISPPLTAAVYPSKLKLSDQSGSSRFAASQVYTEKTRKKEKPNCSNESKSRPGREVPYEISTTKSNKDAKNGTLTAESDAVLRPSSSGDGGASNYPQTLCGISPVADVESPFSFTNAQFPADQTELMLPTTIDGGIDHQKSLMASDYNSFWRYKKHPKGPRPRLNFEIDASQPEKNPHKPITFSDPVFDKSQKNVVRHFGKARIGDGNDVTSNPEKLAQLGYEIAALNEKIATLGDTVKARREKVRLSSRLCRLKRMANHEANKIKLHGLEKEREELSSVIIKVNRRFDHSDNTEESLIEELECLKKSRLKTKVAGQSGEYVNSLLQTYSESYRTRSESDD